MHIPESRYTEEAIAVIVGLELVKGGQMTF
jgi:hypothetical protein